MNDDNVWATDSVGSYASPVASSPVFGQPFGIERRKHSPVLIDGDDLWNGHADGAEEPSLNLIDRSQASTSTTIACSKDFYGLDAAQDSADPEAAAIRNAIIAWLDERVKQVPGVIETSDAFDSPGGPLETHSTREVWGRLTLVNSKMPKYRGSNTEREVLSILSSWNARTRNQPSWDHQRPKAVKKNRESIGPVLFGWDRTDLPQWVDQGDKKRKSRLSQHTGTPLDDAEDNNFGDFETAPSDWRNPPETVHDMSTPQHPGSPPLAVGEWAASLLEPAIAAIPDPQHVPVAIALHSVDLLADTIDHTQNNQADHQTVPLAAERMEEARVVATTAAADEAAWDFSIFEHQIQNPVASPVQTSKPRSASLTPKEREDRATVQRIVSLLPNIEYLLSYFTSPSNVC